MFGPELLAWHKQHLDTTILIYLLPAMSAEMSLNTKPWERSIPIQLISASLAEMRLKRKLVEKINPDSAHLCDASRDEIEEEAKKINYVVCLSTVSTRPKVSE